MTVGAWMAIARVGSEPFRGMYACGTDSNEQKRHDTSKATLTVEFAVAKYGIAHAASMLNGLEPLAAQCAAAPGVAAFKGTMRDAHRGLEGVPTAAAPSFASALPMGRALWEAAAPMKISSEATRARGEEREETRNKTHEGNAQEWPGRGVERE